jgi:hypothetical protein
VISCGRCDDEALWKQLREAYTAAGIYNHAQGDVEGFLSGLELVPPGVVSAQSWRGGWHDLPVAPPVRCTSSPGSRESRSESARRHGRITSLRRFARLVHRASWRRVPWNATARAILGRAGGGNHELPAAAR